MDQAVIQHWACHFRWKLRSNLLPGGMTAEEFLKASPESLDEKVEKVYVKRYYLSMYNVKEGLVNNFSIPKVRKGDVYQILFSCFAWNEATGVAEAFLEFGSQVSNTIVHERMSKLGATGIDTITFQTNDGNFSAASALNHVKHTSKKRGFVTVTHGICNPKLLSKAEKMIADELSQCCHACGAKQLQAQKRQNDGREKEFEYDFMKKRVKIEDSSDCTHEDLSGNEEDFLSFINFNEAVTSAFEDVSRKDSEIFIEETQWIQQNTSPDKKEKFGYVYAAYNTCFEGLIKIGATMKDTPFERLKQLSGTNVPKSFELIACVPSTDPFSLERKAHAYFKSKRIRKEGRLTEFFKLDKETASDYINSLFLT